MENDNVHWEIRYRKEVEGKVMSWIWFRRWGNNQVVQSELRNMKLEIRRKTFLKISEGLVVEAMRGMKVEGQQSQRGFFECRHANTQLHLAFTSPSDRCLWIRRHILLCLKGTVTFTSTIDYLLLNKLLPRRKQGKTEWGRRKEPWDNQYLLTHLLQDQVEKIIEINHWQSKEGIRRDRHLGKETFEKLSTVNQEVKRRMMLAVTLALANVCWFE